MKIYADIDELPGHQHAVLTIGMFDGMHYGHRKLINELVKYAKSIHGTAQVITFITHPTAVLFPERAPSFLRPTSYKLEIMEQLGIDELALIDFSKNFSNIKHQDFIQRLLKYNQKLSLILGYNFRFGKDNLGTLDYIQEVAEEIPDRLQLTSVPEIVYKDQPVSSSHIRNALMDGAVEQGNDLLTEPFFVEGPIIKGKQDGRKIGFPTLNIHPNPVPPIQQGVYATQTLLEGRTWAGMTFFGKKTTGLNPNNPTLLVETHLFDYTKSCYGAVCRVYFHKQIRKPKDFKDFQSLRTQLEQDKLCCLHL